MAFIKIRRKTKLEKRYSKKMGSISVKVTYIRKHLLGIPLRTIHKYRETYYGTIKDCKDCTLTA
ncbi:hypothetical protein [Galbibacter orientalis]|uniref:Uncharacterized protein n=1 Tax=Galbibacter orientalis DSM 19592 TaxID=926559 RepID=I3C555_9FLAO|nr:hypothetical protein [Galbibacter orientalis]EIJ38748.1 hypothetical protein JoomaDRAFT_1741 [Galbibacter orientalis DSM 19592]